MLRKAKRNYYENLDLNDINDDKKFWTSVKPLFCKKTKSVENITLDDNGKLVRNEKEVANIFNVFFVNIVPNMNTEHDFLNTTNISHNPIENAIYKYENHPCVTAIKKHMKDTHSLFSFQTVTKENIAKLITNLYIKKAVQSMDIPTKLVKEFGCLFSIFIASNVNKCTYVDDFKKAKIRPLCKQDGRTEKLNYRPINVLSNVSKIYERCLYDQIYTYLDKIFSRCQCGFRKGISTQNVLLTMIEKLKISRENKQFCAAILTDLSKAVNYIPYDLLIAKLNAYGFDQEALKLIHSYLCDG